MDASRCEEWDRGSLSSWHSDIGILNNIQVLSGIVSFWSTELHEPLEFSKGCEARVQMSWRTGDFCSFSTGVSDIFHLVIWKMSLNLSLCREIQPFFESGRLRVHFTKTRKHRVPLTYIFLRKTPLEELVESWLISSVKDRESSLISRWHGVQGALLQLLYWNWCSSRHDMVISWNLWIFLNHVKPLVLYDV